MISGYFPIRLGHFKKKLNNVSDIYKSVTVYFRAFVTLWIDNRGTWCSSFYGLSAIAFLLPVLLRSPSP